MDNFVSIIFLILFILVLHFISPQFLPHENFPYHTKFILTKSEYHFYLALKPLMDAKSFLICPKVGLKDMFEVNAGTKDRQKYFWKIAQKHVDFLICDSKLRPLFAIELDDKSHKREEVKEKDQFKNRLFESGNLPLFRVPTSSSYSEEYLKRYIKISFLETDNGVEESRGDEL